MIWCLYCVCFFITCCVFGCGLFRAQEPPLARILWICRSIFASKRIYDALNNSQASLLAALLWLPIWFFCSIWLYYCLLWLLLGWVVLSLGFKWQQTFLSLCCIMCCSQQLITNIEKRLVTFWLLSRTWSRKECQITLTGGRGCFRSRASVGLIN